MIYSMTGFGKAQSDCPERKLTIEIKSVNHRYLDLNFRIPRSIGALEPMLRNALKRRLKRGKVDVYIQYEKTAGSEPDFIYNEKLAAAYAAYAEKISSAFGVKNDLTASCLMQFPDVLSVRSEEEDLEKLGPELVSLQDQAVDQLMEARAAEGENLKRDMLEKLSAMEETVEKIVDHEPGIISEYQNRLREKLDSVLEDVNVEENRIAAEVVLYTDKICTDEETVRLQSHFRSMRKTLESGGDVGRKLDFLAQEMNREANTILSKTNDVESSDYAIFLKTGIEKLREQIQNIE